jgi:GT2 family glycosyltransferase
MDISIVVVNYNTRGLTLQCIDSIKTYLTGAVAYEVIVVDNCSSDGSQPALRNYAAKNPWITVIESDDNYGFAHANNRGLSIAQGRQILLLNSDAYLIDNSLINAIHYLDRTTDVFGCGCALLDAQGRLGISYGKFPGVSTVLKEVATNRFARLRAMVPSCKDCVYPIDLPCGAFFLIKHELLNVVGYLDEAYFMYSEETDLACRAWKAGYRIVYYGYTSVVHLGGQSSVPSGSDYDKLAAWKKQQLIFYHSWRYYLTKNGAPWEPCSVKALLTLFFMTLLILAQVIGKKNMRLTYQLELEMLRKGWTSSDI